MTDTRINTHDLRLSLDPERDWLWDDWPDSEDETGQAGELDFAYHIEPERREE